jgi:hypothetical protein
MNMRSDTKQYSFTARVTDSTRFSGSFPRARDGFTNGSDATRKMDLRVLRKGAGPRRKFGEKLPIGLLKGFFPCVQSWSLIELDGRPSLVSVQKSFNGNFGNERSETFPPSLPLQGLSPDIERGPAPELRDRATLSFTPPLKQKKWGISSRRISWVPDISVVQKELPASTPFTPWMWLGIQPSPVNLMISNPFLFVNISLTHGKLLESLNDLSWTMRWPLQGEDAIDIVSPKSCVCICFWESIWSLFPKENLEEMRLWRVLIASGKKESSIDIDAQRFMLSGEPVNDFCSIITIKNPTGDLLKKKTAQDSQGGLETVLGEYSNTCPEGFVWIATKTPEETSLSLLPKEESRLFERLTLMVGLRSMDSPTSSEKNSKANMSSQRFLFIRNDWWLNTKTESSSLFLFPLKVLLLFLWVFLQISKLDQVYDVMRSRSIRKRFTML